MQLKIISLCVVIIAVANALPAHEDALVPENTFLETEDMGIADAKKKVTDLTTTVAADENDVTEKTKAVADAQTAADEATKTYDAAVTANKALHDALDTANDDLTKAQSTVAADSLELGKHKTDLDGANAELAVANKNCAGAKAALDSAQQGLADAKNSLDSMSCDKNTGGTCRVWSCHSSRGATCMSPYCMCTGDYECAEGGKCVEFTDKVHAKEHYDAMAKEVNDAQEASSHACGLVEDVASVSPAEAESSVKAAQEEVTHDEAVLTAAKGDLNTAIAAQKTAQDALDTSAVGKAKADATTANDNLVASGTALSEAKVQLSTTKGDLAAAKAEVAALEKNCGAAKAAGDSIRAELASAKASFDSMSCGKDTGGTCRVWSCHSSRGATCISPNCMCTGDRECAQGGKCVRFTEKDDAEQKVHDLSKQAEDAEAKEAEACL